MGALVYVFPILQQNILPLGHARDLEGIVYERIAENFFSLKSALVCSVCAVCATFCRPTRMNLSSFDTMNKTVKDMFHILPMTMHELNNLKFMLKLPGHQKSKHQQRRVFSEYLGWNADSSSGELRRMFHVQRQRKTTPQVSELNCSP